MAKYCFDIDGTISAAPSIFAEIMRGLKSIGHEVYPLTGTIVGSDPTPEESRYKQLKFLGLERYVHYDDVIVCEGINWQDCGEMKGKYCKENNIHFMVEDAKPFFDSINKHSPQTLVLRMPACQ